MNETRIKNRDYDFIFKVVITGDSGVGKSQLLSRFAKNQFSLESKNTIGVEFATKIVEVDGRIICVHIWDTAGQERFRSTCGAYYKGAVGSLVVYDITKVASFQSVQRWLDELNQHTGGLRGVTPVTMLVGNKLDLRHIRSVSSLEAEHMARENKLFSMETSALDATNVSKAFDRLIHEIYDRVKVRELAALVQKGSGLENGAQTLKMWKNPIEKAAKTITTRPTKLSQTIKQKYKEENIKMGCPKFACLC